jgi:hypothetical protein
MAESTYLILENTFYGRRPYLKVPVAASDFQLILQRRMSIKSRTVERHTDGHLDECMQVAVILLSQKQREVSH